ncbi:hypothetical protein OsI_01651 [Oryza sativa Indica Group]|uniref:Uncharacterized protein n=1 Tax=Oryza sativa subsp. indica TaxID=39946 RepID=A2WP82_ORYSI|nr:hypothetical protein OsI_01651 [Oryza sativa Indica Group]
MLRALAGVRVLVAAADPLGVELTDMLIDDTDANNKIAELLLASLDAGIPFSRHVNGSYFAIARERNGDQQQFEYRDGEITKEMRGNFDQEGESTCTYSEFPFVYGAELVLSSRLGGEAASRLARPSSPHRMANATRQRLTTSRPLLRLSPPPPRWCSPPPPPHGPPRRTTDGKNMSTISKKSSTSTHTFAPPAPPLSSPSMLMYDGDDDVVALVVTP